MSFEHCREQGQQEDRDQGDHERSDGDDDDRVDHGRAGLPEQALAGFVVLGQHLQRLGHAAARLGHLDHAEEHRAERLRLPRHRLFEGRAAADAELESGPGSAPVPSR